MGLGGFNQKKFMKNFLLISATFIWISVLAISCQSETKNHDDYDHKGHDHSAHNHDGHNHDGHSHDKTEKTNVETLVKDCKSCGMPSDQTNWRVKYAPPQKETTFFCSPKCYFSASLSEKEYSTGEYVTFSVFGENKTVEAKKAFFVKGTNEKNPMNVNDFLVTDSEESAKKWQTQKKGKEIFTFEKITPEMIKSK